MKFTKVVKAEFTDTDLDRIEQIVNDIVTKSYLPIDVDRRSDYVQVLMDTQDLNYIEYRKYVDEFKDIVVEIKIKLLQEFRSKVQFNPIWGDSVGLSIRSN